MSGKASASDLELALSGPLIVFGGSYDPPHRGHLALAKAAQKLIPLASIIMVPAAKNPLKQFAPQASNQQRLEMLHLLTVDTDIVVSDIEINRSGVGVKDSYTVDTIKDLLKSEKRREVYLLIGADALVGESSAHSLLNWKEIAELARLVSFIVASRPGAPAVTAKYLQKNGYSAGLAEKLLSRILQLDQAVSSSEVRVAAADGKWDRVADLTSEKIAQYIRAKKIYYKQ